MPKPSPKDPGSPTGKISDKRTSNRKKAAPAKPIGLGSVILFWPFHIFHAFIRPLPKALRLPLRAGGDLAIAGLYAGLAMAVFYFVRARPFDMAKVAEMPQRPGWASLSALREGRACGLDGPQWEPLVRPGPRLPEAAEALADCLARLPGAGRLR